MKKYFLLFILFLVFMSATRAQWTNQNAGFVNDTLGFYDFSIVDASTVWSVCYDGKAGLFSNRPILDFTRTTNGGSTWTAGKMGNDNSLAFSNISAVSATEAWVCMHKIDFSGGGGLFHTTNGGVTWTQSNPGVVFNNNSFPNFVYFKDAQNGIAGGDPNAGGFEVYRTTNGGNTWARVAAANLPAPLANEFGWFNGYAVIGNTFWFGTSSGRIYKSTNFGMTWSVSTVDPTGNGLFEIAFNDDGLRGVTHVRSATETFLYNTADGGITWTKLPSPSKWKTDRICAVPGTNALISTSTSFSSLGGSSISYNNGVSWTELENINPKAAAKFLNRTTGWAGGFFIAGPPLSGGMFKSNIDIQLPPIDLVLTSFSAQQVGKSVKLNWSLNDETRVRSYSVEFSRDSSVFFTLQDVLTNGNGRYEYLHNNPDNAVNYYRITIIQNDGTINKSEIRRVVVRLENDILAYPNPASNVLNVGINDDLIAKNIKISLIDGQGKQVLTKASFGVRAVALDVSAVPNGIYFLQVSSNNRTYSKKVVVVK